MNRLVLLPVLVLVACKPAAQEAKPGVPSAPTGVVAAAAPTPAVAPAVHQAKDCAAEAAGAPKDDKPTEIKDAKTGATILASGAKLANVPGISVAELLAAPESYAGKTVHLEGNVSAMCHHMRSWFSIQSEDKSGGVVRVMAAPAFLVPEGSIGKRARTEGVVELVEIPLEQAQHYAAEHNLPLQTKAAVIRASGAEFM